MINGFGMRVFVAAVMALGVSLGATAAYAAPPACRQNPSLCNDGNPCTVDACGTRGCTHRAAVNGTTCNDGSACTTSDVCTAGVCGGKAVTCNDQNVCTSDSCNPASGCTYANNTASCNDGSACSTGDVCSGGTCRGTTVTCNDQNGCTNDACNPATGCTYTNNSASCNDGSACTASDVCSAGRCVGTAVSCDDGNPCTSDSCDPVQGCKHANNTVACDDGSACTTGDVCAAGRCAGTALGCDDQNPCTDDRCDPVRGCVHDGNTNACDDADTATRDDVCNGSGVCGGTPIICAPGPCEDAAIPNGASCDIVYSSDATPCDDADAHTRDDLCDGQGTCAGAPYTCTPAACEAASVPNGIGCDVTLAPAGTACDDGDACTTSDACAAGRCTGSVLTCDDQNPCSDDTCDAVQGCQHAANTAACDDGTACTTGDVCAGGRCAGTALDCDDQNPCTDDRCDPVRGCVHDGNTNACDDADLATRDDVCNGSGVCGGTAIVCAPGPCEDAAIPNGASCDIVYSSDATPCDDADAHTRDDLCDGQGTCAGAPYTCTPAACEAASVPNGVGCDVTLAPAGTACDDGDACTTSDTCADGVCTSGPATVCNTPPGACYALPGTCTQGACAYTYDSLSCSGVAVAMTYALDEAGNALADVTAEVWFMPAWNVVATSDARGRLTLAQTAGTFSWRFTKDGYLAVTRSATLPGGAVTTVPSPWLAARHLPAVTVNPTTAADAATEDGAVSIAFAPGTVDAPSDVTVTALHAQTLPGFLPRGWSPLQAFWFESSVALDLDVRAAIDLWDALAADDVVVLVRWDDVAVAWSTEALIPASDAAWSIVVTLEAPGVYAIAVADRAPLSPPEPTLGTTLDGVSALDPNLAELTGSGRMTPDVNLASLDAPSVTATGILAIAAPAPVTSGLVIPGTIENSYLFSDGATTQVAPAPRTFVAYQRPPADPAAAITIQFWTRPDALYPRETLAEGATVITLVPTPPADTRVIDQKGGQLTSADLTLTVAPGALDGPRALGFAALTPAAAGFSGAPGVTPVLAFQLEVDGLVPGHPLALAFPPGVPNAAYVLARVRTVDGHPGLEPVERFAADSTGQLLSLEPAPDGLQSRLPGLVQSGAYVLCRLALPVGLVLGTVDDQAAAAPDMPVAIADAPWLTTSDPAGAFRLVAAVGTRQVHAWKPASTREAWAEATLADATSEAVVTLSLDLVGPRVLATNPAAGATAVNPSTAIIVTFSEPVRAPSGLAKAVVLAPTASQDSPPVAAALALSSDGKTLTVLPDDALAFETAYTLTLAASQLTDRDALALVGTPTFTFTTRAATARGLGAELVIYAPGSASHACNPAFYDPSDPSVICVVGSQGSADPDASVVLMNEGTGVLATVVAAADGSFQGTLPATMDDFVSATFVNANGTFVYVPVIVQHFDSGHIGLFHSGGALTAKNESGRTAKVLFEPSAIPEKILVKLDVLDATALGKLLADLQTTTWDDDLGVAALGAMHLQYGGDDLAASADIEFPLEPASVASLLPPDVAPEDAGFALTVRHEDPSGDVTYQVVDRMHYETQPDGKPVLATHSFPFMGLMPQGGAGGGYLGHTAMADLFLCPFYIGGNASAVTGHVYSCPVAPTAPAKCLSNPDGTPNMTPLSGATVFTYPTNRADPAPGKLPRGAAYAVANDDGKFALMAPVGTQGVTLMATHPAYPMLATSYATPLANGNDLVFYVDEQAIKQKALERAPAVQTYHTPQPAPIGVTTPATFVVVASHASGVPALDVVIHKVTSLVDGVSATAADVTVGAPSKIEAVSTTGARTFLPITSTKALRLELEVRVAAAGQATRVMHIIDFGGAPPHVDTAIAPPDPNDRQGPSVVSAWPAQFSTGLSPSQPLVVTFNEPIDRGIETAPALVRLLPDIGAPTVVLSADQRTLTITSSQLQPGTTYNLVLGTGIVDLVGNPLDQAPNTPDSYETYRLAFSTAPVRAADLPEMGFGEGAVIKGNFAYALDRAGALDGALVVYDLSNPTAPAKAAELDLPARPNDLVLIDHYQFVRADGAAPETKDLLAIVGGRVGVAEPWLWVVDISNPKAPLRVSGEWVSPSPQALVTKVTWSAPNLAYLEFDGDRNSVSVVNLQMFIYAESLATADYLDPEYPADGRPGVDGNGDGDYADESDGDILPLPAADSFTFAGHVEAYVVTDTTQAILDYDYDARQNYLGVVLDAGVALSDRTPATPSYRTLAASGYIGLLDLPRTTADFAFAADARPKRLLTLFGVPLALSAGGPVAPHDLALVSLVPATGETTTLVILDISSVTAVKQIGAVAIAASHGIVQSAVVQDDGLIRLNASKDALILDPARLALAPIGPTKDADHPAIVGVIPGAGASQVTLQGTSYGLTAINHGAKTKLVQSAPTLGFVYFPTAAALVDPATLVDNPSAIATLTSSQTSLTTLPLARYRAEAGVVSTIDPASPKTHYYVRISAPGAAGATIDLALESLDAAGLPLGGRGPGFPAVHAMSAATLSTLGATAQAGEAAATTFKAWRLSSDPTSRDYNVYLSQPFALVYERIDATKLASLEALGSGRTLLWSGAFTRVTLDPAMASNAVLGPFAARASASDQCIYPGAAAIAQSLPADYIMGPNPTPIGGGATIDGTVGHVRALNGDMTANAVDMALAGRRLPIVFARFLASQDLHDGRLGRGWDSPYFQRLTELESVVFREGSKLPLVVRGVEGKDEIAETGDILFHDGRGRTIIYTHASDTELISEYISDPLMRELGWLDKIAASYRPPRGVFDALVRFQSGQFARLTPGGEQYWYSPRGRLEKIYDRYPANALTFVYNDEGQLTMVRDESSRASGGRYVEFGYYRPSGHRLFRADLDEATTVARWLGKFCRIQDHTGRDVLYLYDDVGQLRQVRGIEVTGSPVFTGRRTSEYGWSDAGRLKSVVPGGDGAEPAFAVAATDLAGESATAGTGVQGAVGITMATPNTAAAIAQGGATTHVTRADGSEQEIAFDRDGRPTKVVAGAGSPEARTQTFETNADGLVTKATYPNGAWVVFMYDSENANLRARGNLLAIERHAGVGGGPTLTATWPAEGYDLRTNMPAGATTDYAGNSVDITLTADGRSIEKRTFKDGATQAIAGSETFGHNEFGQLIAHRSPAAGTQTWDFDDDGFLVEHIVGAGAGSDQTTKYVYAGSDGRRGLPTQIDVERGADVTLEYSARGEMTKRTRGSRVETWAYDAAGRLCETTEQVDDALRRVVTYGWLRGQFLETVTDSGVRSDDAGTAYDLTTTNVSDAIGRVDLVKLPGGETVDYSYYPNGEVRAVTQGQNVTLQTYDATANVAYVHYGSLASGKFLAQRYDGHGRVIAVSTTTPGAALGASDALTEYGYDGNGAATSVTVSSLDGVDARVERSLDALGRVTALRQLKDDGTFATTTYAYTVPGQVVTTGPTGLTTTVALDAAGRLESESTAIPGVTLNSTVQAYDGNGNLIGSQRTDGILSNTLGWAYDDYDHATEYSDSLGIYATIAPRLDGMPLSVTDALAQTTSYAYSQLGERLGESRPDGVAIHHGYDKNRQPAATTDNAAKGDGFVYDASLRLQKHARRNGEQTIVNTFDVMAHPTAIALPGGATAAAEYDTLGRLKWRKTTTADPLLTDERFTYDGVGRPLTSEWSSGSMAFAYDLLGPLASVDYTIESASTTYRATLAETHDDSGARKSLTYPDGLMVTETRDAAGRLASLAAGDETFVASTTYAASSLIGTRGFMGGQLQLENVWDLRGRLLRRTYRNAAGALLSEDRYAYDAAGHPVARQAVHLGGRTDFFALDADARLLRADVEARPATDRETVPVLAGFVVPAELGGTWSPGPYAREVRYDAQGLDLIEAITPVDPFGQTLPTLAETYANPDGSLQPQVITFADTTLQRGPADARGNVQKTLLHPRWGTPTLPPIVATLTHDALDRLAQAKGIQQAPEPTLTFNYDPSGLLVRREVLCASAPCTPSETLFLWNHGRLVAEWDAHVHNLKTRYVYAEGDVPVAAHVVADEVGTTYYYLTDALGSVTGVVDTAGEVVERVRYDAWGQPSFELRDVAAPEIANVKLTNGHLALVFTEEITAPLTAPAGDAIITTAASLAGAVTATVNGVATAATLAYDAGHRGDDYGAVVNVTLAKTPAVGATIVLTVAGSRLMDRWQNGNRAQTLTFTWTGVEGATLIQSRAQGATAPVRPDRSSIGNAILWQGQYFDYDTGFYYLRGRWYDPATAAFLEQDPRAYQDSTNPYQAMRNNPIAYRDPTGHSAETWLANHAAGLALGSGIKRAAESVATWMSDSAYGAGDVAEWSAFAAGGTITTVGTLAEGFLSAGGTWGGWSGTDWRKTTLLEDVAGALDAVGTLSAFAAPFTKLGGWALDQAGTRLFSRTFDDALRGISVGPPPPPPPPPTRLNFAGFDPEDLARMRGTLSFADDGEQVYAMASEGTLIGELSPARTVARQGGHREVAHEFGLDMASPNVRGGTASVFDGEIRQMNFVSGQLNMTFDRTIRGYVPKPGCGVLGDDPRPRVVVDAVTRLEIDMRVRSAIGSILSGTRR